MGYKKLEELLSKAKKTSLEFVLCFLDINNLKKINDTYGHMEGDRYIVFFCNLIKNKLQAEDVFFRMGGDEFIIIFMNNNKSQAEVIWKEYRKEFEEVNRKGELPYSISASHGLFYYQSGMEIDVDQIIEKADRQMYKEKRRHKKEFNSKAIVHPENSEERTQYTS